MTLGLVIHPCLEEGRQSLLSKVGKVEKRSSQSRRRPRSLLRASLRRRVSAGWTSLRLTVQGNRKVRGWADGGVKKRARVPSGRNSARKVRWCMIRSSSDGSSKG